MFNERKLKNKRNSQSIISTYLDHVFVSHRWLFDLQNASSSLLVPEKSTHWLFRGVGISLLSGLLLWLVILAFAYFQKYHKLVTNKTINFSVLA